MHAGYANAIFAWTVIWLIALFHFGFIVGFFIKKKSKSKRGGPPRVRKKCSYYLIIGQTIIILLGYAVFFYWTCYVFLPQLKDSRKCFSGYNLLDFLNWFSHLLTTRITAILVFLTCFFLIVCGSSIYSIVREALLQKANSQSQHNAVIDAIVQRKFNPHDFT